MKVDTMNQNELSEKLLLTHPDMRIYQRIRYELYKLLNIDFNLFFAEDIYNYTGSIHILEDSHTTIEITHPNYNNVNESELQYGFLLILGQINPFIMLITDKNISVIGSFTYMIKTLVSNIKLSHKQLHILRRIQYEYIDAILYNEYTFFKPTLFIEIIQNVKETLA